MLRMAVSEYSPDLSVRIGLQLDLQKTSYQSLVPGSQLRPVKIFAS
jgi:hypothetical protein